MNNSSQRRYSLTYPQSLARWLQARSTLLTTWPSSHSATCLTTKLRSKGSTTRPTGRLLPVLRGGTCSPVIAPGFPQCRHHETVLTTRFATRASKGSPAPRKRTHTRLQSGCTRPESDLATKRVALLE